MPKALAPLYILSGLFALLLNFSRLRAAETRPTFLAALLIGSVLFFSLSWLWTIAPYETLRLILPITGLFILGLVIVILALDLNESERRLVCRSIVIGSTIGFVILFVEIFWPLKITSFFFSIFKGIEYQIDYTYKNALRNGANISALLVIPAAAVLWRSGNRYFTLGLILLALITLTNAKAGASLLALLVGLAAIAVTIVSGRYVRVLFSSLLVISALALPVVVQTLPTAGEIEERYPNLPNSVYPRIFIWQSTARYISENPFLGKGFNSSRSISKPGDRVEYFTKGVNPRGSIPIPLHPHSAILQIWLELGVVGIGIFLALLLTILKRIEQSISSLPMRAMAYGSFCSAFTIANVSYGIWQNWWISALWLTVAFTIIATKDDPPLTGKHEPTP